MVYIMLIINFTDTTVRIEVPSGTEMEEREGLAFWNVVLPKSGGVQGEGVYWRRVGIISQGGTNSGGL